MGNREINESVHKLEMEKSNSDLNKNNSESKLNKSDSMNKSELDNKEKENKKLVHFAESQNTTAAVPVDRSKSVPSPEQIEKKKMEVDKEIEEYENDNPLTHSDNNPLTHSNDNKDNKSDSNQSMNKSDSDKQSNKD